MSAAAAPWAGRRLHFVGVGGAGMSGYARAAHALGAQVSGSDGADGAVRPAPGRRRRAAGADRPRRRQRARRATTSSSSTPRPCPPRTPSARPRASAACAERPRAQLLAELTALRRTIAVAGTHGKTTTASMAVHALRARRHGPGLAGRRHRRRRAAQLALERRRVAGRRGRRVRPLDAQPERGDRRADERRARPPRRLRVAGASCARPFARSPRWPRARSSCGIAPSCSR